MELRDDCANLCRCGDVATDLEPALLPGVAVTVVRAAIAHDVLCDQPAVLGVGEDAGQRHQNLAHHNRRAVLSQPVLEFAYERH